MTRIRARVGWHDYRASAISGMVRLRFGPVLVVGWDGLD